VYDRKTVRRRRAVLGLLVACSLILLTAYFGESAGGGLHAVQRGFLEVLSPIESVANRALKPFRDLFGWAGDTLDAKGKNKALTKERDALRNEVVRIRTELSQSKELDALAQLRREAGLDAMGPVTARVIVRSPTVWYSTVNIDKGTVDGVHVNQPVVTGAGLVGRVSQTTSHAAQVTLLTDHSSGVTARIAETGVGGLVQTGTPGNPNDLLLQFIPRGDKVDVGQRVVTAGIESRRRELTSYYPPGIAVGVVTKVDPNELDTSQQVHMRPYADLRGLELVQVLTSPKLRPQGVTP
jgi:rod shape-determining protein MreC